MAGVSPGRTVGRVTPGPPPRAAQLLDSVFFPPLREALAKMRARFCPVLEDLDFVLWAVARVLQENASGRDFFQTKQISSLHWVEIHHHITI
jgi:hypothetical protein